MMTQHYPVLRYSTYLIIFVLHVSVLVLLYNYSTKLSLDRVGINQKEQTENVYDDFSIKGQEAKVSFQEDQSTQQPLPNDQITEESLTKSNDRARPETSFPEQPSPQATLDKLIIEQPKKERNVTLTEPIQQVMLPKRTPITRTSPQRKTKTPRGTPSLPSDTPLTNAEDSNRLAIPPKAFFQAFKNSYYQEQALLGNTQSLNNESASLKPSSESESLINQRLGELKIADYIQQIKKAFQEAARRTPGMYLNSGKELKTDLDVTLEIQSQGTVKIAKFQSSGITEIDEYIKKFLLDIIVNPIPKRYKVNALPFSTKILININKDTRFYTIRCFF